MRLRRRNACLALGSAAFAFFASAALPAHATSISPFTWSHVQRIAQDSDAIVVGRFRGAKSKGDPRVLDSKSVDEFEIERVLIGDTTLAGTNVALEHSSGDDPFAGAKDRVLVFMRQEGARWAIDGYGVVNLVGDDVDMWLEGKPHGTRTPLAELVAFIRDRLPRAKVRWSVKVEPRASLATGILNVEFVAKNSGTQTTQIIPPSLCFDALRAYRLKGGVWDSSIWWQGVEHWSFAKRESLVALAPGAEKKFRYAIPMRALGINAAAEYDVYARLEMHRLTTAGDASMPRKTAGVWLGGLHDEKTRVEVVP